MVKLRPVLVIPPQISTRSALTTVVALSTTPPNPVCDYHYLLPRASMPYVGLFQKNDTWVKGDMVCAVGFHRLDLIRLGKKKGWQEDLLQKSFQQRHHESRVLLRPSQHRDRSNYQAPLTSIAKSYFLKTHHCAITPLFPLCLCIGHSRLHKDPPSVAGPAIDEGKSC